MKFVIALLIANTSALTIRQMDAPAPIPVDIAFAGSFSDSPASAGYVQINADPAAAKGKEGSADTPELPGDAPAAAAPVAAPKALDAEAAKVGSAKADAAKKAAEPVVAKVLDGEKGASTDATEKEAKAKAIAAAND